MKELTQKIRKAIIIDTGSPSSATVLHREEIDESKSCVGIAAERGCATRTVTFVIECF